MQTPTATETNPGLTRPLSLHPFVPSRLCMALVILFLLLPLALAHSEQRTGLSIGLASTNWDRLASAGFLVQHSKHFATFTTADVGGGIAAAQVQEAILFPLDSCCYLGFMLGPEVAIYQEHPSISDKLTYLNTAVGAFIWLDAGPTLSIMAVAEYIDSDADLSRYKLRLQLTIWLHE